MAGRKMHPVNQDFTPNGENRCQRTANLYGVGAEHFRNYINVLSLV